MEDVMIDDSSLVPQLVNDETQIIFQRHCAYDKESGTLLDKSVAEQKIIVKNFLNYMSDNLENTYFLFSASNTSSSNEFKRCVETINIAMDLVKNYYTENGISTDHIMNLNDKSNYNASVHESRYLIEPGMFTDQSGFLEYLKDKYDGINLDFWIDFEEDLSKQKREQFGSEGPDEIVQRSLRYINILERYSEFFHTKYPDSRLIIWNGTHYDLISPLVKQRVLNLEKSDYVGVKNCGGISLIINSDGKISSNVNGTIYPFDSQCSKQPRQYF